MSDEDFDFAKNLDQELNKDYSRSSTSSKNHKNFKMNLYVYTYNSIIFERICYLLKKEKIWFVAELKPYMNCNDIIQLVVTKLNKKLDKNGSDIRLDASKEAINSYYEVYLTEEEDTGEPSDDLPSFERSQTIHDINQTELTVNIENTDKAIKYKEQSVITTGIQSLIENTADSKESSTIQQYSEPNLSKEERGKS